MLRRLICAVVVVWTAALATACQEPNCVRSSKVTDRLSGTISVSSGAVSGSGDVFEDELDHTQPSSIPPGLKVSFSATWQGFVVYVDSADSTGPIPAMSLHVPIALPPTSSPTSFSVDFCTCPDDHPIYDGKRCLTRTGIYSAVSTICESLPATIMVFAHSGPDCDNRGSDNSACGERLDADLTVPPHDSAPFSGTLSIRHEIDVMKYVCNLD